MKLFPILLFPLNNVFFSLCFSFLFFFFKQLVYLFLLFSSLPHACWILIPQPGTISVPSALGAQSLNYYTTREVSSVSAFLLISVLFFHISLSCSLLIHQSHLTPNRSLQSLTIHVSTISIPYLCVRFECV